MRRSQNFDFVGLKNLSPAPTHTDIIEFQNFCLQFKNQTSGSNCVRLSYYFHFERSYEVLKLKSLCILLNKNTKPNRKWKIIHTVLERRTLCFSSYKNRKLKVEL